MSIGPAEIIIVLILALLVFGPKRLPQMGKSLGKGVREFRKAAETAKTELGLGEVTDQINEVKSTFTEPHQGRHRHASATSSRASTSRRAIEAPVAGHRRHAAGGGARSRARRPRRSRGAGRRRVRRGAGDAGGHAADGVRRRAARAGPARRSPSPSAAETPRSAGRARVAGRPVAAGSPAGPATGA